MRPQGLGRRLRRRLWIPVVLALSAMVSVGAVAMRAGPEYTATTTIVAKNPASLDKPRSFSDVATSNTVMLRVKKKLGLDESVESVAGRVQVTSGRSDLYSITVRDTDPGRAVRVADAIAGEAATFYEDLGAGASSSVAKQLEQQGATYQQRYQDAAKALTDFRHQHPEAVNPAKPEQVDSDIAARYMKLQLDERAAGDAYVQFQGRAMQAQVDALSNRSSFSATIVDQATAKPDNTGRLFKVLYAGVLALVVGAALVLFGEYRDRSVSGVPEVEDLIGAPVIAAIPRAGRRPLRRRSA